MNIHLMRCTFPPERANGTTSQSVQATYHVSSFAMITSFFNSIQALISLYKDGSLGLAAYAYYKGALPGSYTPSKCLFYW